MSAPTVERVTETVDFSDPTQRRRRLRRRIAVVALVVGAALLGWLVWFSPVLTVTTVRAVGVEGEQATAVLAAAAIPLGTPLARVDAAAAQEAVLRLPWVSSAEIRRGWPHEVVVAVTYRTAVAVDAASGRAVDAEGVVFDAAGPLPKSLPKVVASGVGLTTAMAVLTGLPADLAPRVESVTATTRDDVDLVMHSGATVHWGSAGDAAFKARVLRALLKHKRDVYDVTAPEVPTTFRAP